MDKYNVKTKIYPDGTELTKVYDYSIKIDEQKKNKVKCFTTEKQIDIENYLLQNEIKKSDNRERKERENKSRAVQTVYDYAKSNTFRWFITFTVNDDVCDRFNYDAVASELKKFRKWLSKRKIPYIFVPEQHKNGAWHIHGVVGDGIKVKRAINPYTGKPITKKGHKIYNVTNYNSGFSTVSIIKDKNRTNTYITKYITKSISVPKGRKRYWCSEGLQRPKEVVRFIKPESKEYFEYFQNTDYMKRIDNEYGTLFICEKRAADK